MKLAEPQEVYQSSGSNFISMRRKGVRFVINWEDKPNKKGAAMVAASLNKKMVRLS